MRYFLLLLLLSASGLQAQDAAKLLKDVKARMDQVRDYSASGKLKTDVDFLKIPVSTVQVYYKQPNLFKIRKEDGISLLPKNGVSVNLNALLMSNDYTAVAAGESNVEGTPVKVVKLLPNAENGEVVLTTMYIDEKKQVVRKSTTTTRDNGTYDMVMQYGKYEKYGLPDKVVFTFNTKDYKLPKGVTFEYDAGTTAKQQQPKSNKGRVEITYDAYVINKGIPDSVWK